MDRLQGMHTRRAKNGDLSSRNGGWKLLTINRRVHVRCNQLAAVGRMAGDTTGERRFLFFSGGAGRKEKRWGCGLEAQTRQIKNQAREMQCAGAGNEARGTRERVAGMRKPSPRLHASPKLTDVPCQYGREADGVCAVNNATRMGQERAVSPPWLVSGDGCWVDGWRAVAWCVRGRGSRTDKAVIVPVPDPVPDPVPEFLGRGRKGGTWNGAGSICQKTGLAKTKEIRVHRG